MSFFSPPSLCRCRFAEVVFRNAHGLTPLMYAITLGNTGVAQVCLRRISPKCVDIRDQCGRQSTALHLAAARGDIVLILALLHRGADPTLMDNNGLTPAVIAKNHNKETAFGVLTNQRKPILPFSLYNFFSFVEPMKKETQLLLLCLARLKIRLPRDCKALVLKKLYDKHYRAPSTKDAAHQAPNFAANHRPSNMRRRG